MTEKTKYLLAYVEHRREEEPKTAWLSETPKIGKVICPDDAYSYCICDIITLKSGPQLLLGPPDEDGEEAYKRAIEEGHLLLR